MKKFLNTSLIAALMLISSVAFANDGFMVKVASEKEKTIRFFINETKDLNLTITGKDNEVLFEEKMHSAGSSTKTYNLNALPTGEYTMKVESDLEISKYSIIITGDKALLSNPVITTIYKPLITKNNNIVTLDLDHADKLPVAIQIFNENNDELYSEVFNNKSKLVKKYNIARTNAKSLTFVVNVNDQKFVKTVSTY